MQATIAPLMKEIGNIHPSTATLTTLYDLIAALHDETNVYEDELVTATVMHLLSSGRIKFLGDREELKRACA